MEDKQIVDLYWQRSEIAILETSKKYGQMCYSIAYKILRDNEDSEECLNDTYLSAWNSMPTNRPNILTAFLAKITRNLSINRYVHNSAQKRGGGEHTLAFEELTNFARSADDPEAIIDEMHLSRVLNEFLDGLSERNHDIFLSRYWENSTIAEIAEIYGMNQNTVKTSLHRMKEELKEVLINEEVFI